MDFSVEKIENDNKIKELQNELQIELHWVTEGVTIELPNYGANYKKISCHKKLLIRI